MDAGRWHKLRPLLARLVRAGSWTFAAVTFAAAILVQWAGDSSWPMTLLTFGPRWIALLPLAPLAAGAVALSRRALLPLLLGTCCALGPVMGFCLPWRFVTASEPQNALSLRMVTLNVDEGIDLPALIQFLNEVKPDIVALQEGPYPPALVAAFRHGWYKVGTGDVFIASRYPIVKRSLSPLGQGRSRAPAIRCDVQTGAGVIHVNCLHLYTLREGLDRVIKDWWKGAPELERVTALRNEESQLSAGFANAFDGPAVVLGDFNMTSDSSIFHRDWHDWQDAFSTRGFGLGYTFSTNRIGLRIDHVLVDKRHWHIRSCRVGPDLHGQHRPVVAELLLLDKTS